MANERLRTALDSHGWDVPEFAASLHVDAKTVERWLATGRTPHRKTAVAAATLLQEEPGYLWPNIGRRVASDTQYGEVVTVFTERTAVPNALWLSLLRSATESVDILVYAGLHLPEGNPTWVREIQQRCQESVRVRIAFGDPESAEVERRGVEEGVGAGMAARIRYALAWYQPIIGTPNLSIGFHSTTLYNSILRFDDQMLINPHIYAIPAFRAPVLQLRRIQDGPLFETYTECFEHVWSACRAHGQEG